MIWHIFKKDWKLLWPMVAIVAAVQFAAAAMWIALGHFTEPLGLFRVWQYTPVIAWLGIAALITTAVHQDTVPGDRHDWLARPVCHGDVIAAKLLFIVIAVHGPMLLADLAHGLATGFSFWNSLTASLARGIALLLDWSLPAFAVAAMTSTLAEFIGGVLILALVEIGLIAAIPEFFFGGFDPPIMLSGLAWMRSAFMSVVALATVAVVVPLLYFQRSTRLARSIVLVAALVAPLAVFLPWAPAFAFQQWLSVGAATAEPITVEFNPTLGKLSLEPGRPRPVNSLWLPIRVSGLPRSSMMVSDVADIRIVGRDGTTLYRWQMTDGRQDTDDPYYVFYHVAGFPVRTAAGGNADTFQLINLPGKLYERVRNQPVRVELDYSLTLFRVDAEDTIRAVRGDKRISDIGWCKTRIDQAGDRIEMGCLNPGDSSICVTAELENAVSGQRNPAYNSCRPDYRPITAHFELSPMNNLRARLSFHDPQGLAKYPVDSSQLANAQVLVKTYKPVAHFTRQVVISEVRLGDWEAEAQGAAANTASVR